jgi:5-bromo-4-chloroindolyl phosphate hydrolysis protein
MAQNEDSIYSQINSGSDIDDINISKRLQEELDLAGIATEDFLTYIENNINEAKDKIESLAGGKTSETLEKINKLTADDW